jgi:hypothetical protein
MREGKNENERDATWVPSQQGIIRNQKIKRIEVGKGPQHY